MFAQRRGNRDEQSLASFARCQCNLITFEIDLRPGQRSEIAETLASVEPALDQTRPFFIGNAQDGAELVNCERASLENGAVLDGLDSFCRILEEIAFLPR